MEAPSCALPFWKPFYRGMGVKPGIGIVVRRIIRLDKVSGFNPERESKANI
jgi:hypothetical protein